MITATRLRNALSQGTHQDMDTVARDLDTMKEKLARLQARGGLFATINFGDAVHDLMGRIEKTAVASS
ncbi:MAG: hypothetical protein P1V97_30810 [Planctomycetota bacterium]|nr:hypothetical protein [Planctomycetota bacterium]